MIKVKIKLKILNLLSLDYKQNIAIIQFTIDLIWNLNDVKFESKTEFERDDLIVRALTSLITVIIFFFSLILSL